MLPYRRSPHRTSRALLPLALLPALLTLEGCATSATSASAPSALKNFDALYASGIEADTLAIQAATAALNAGALSAAQASRVLQVTDAIKTVLDAAYATAQGGNLGIANGNLAQGLGQVAILSACLTQKPLTVALFDTCAAKLVVPEVAS